MSSQSPRRLDLLSVVAPVFNEADTLEEFHQRVCATLGSLPFELILVDDGSLDASGEILERIAAADPRVKVIRTLHSVFCPAQ